MKRDALNDLKSWLVADDRKPLVLRGARQVGKTWLVRELAAVTDRNLVELNFERNTNDVTLFADRDVARTLRFLEARFGQRIDPESSLLFLDEIQAAPEVFANLRWFAEEQPDLPVIAAGSLLDFVLEDHSFSMPVGRISYLHLDVMGFEEFLDAIGDESLQQFIGDFRWEQTIPAALHAQLLTRYREYLFVGGMPAAVANWITHRSPITCAEVHHGLVATYRDDFHKYRKRIPLDRLVCVFDAIPQMMGRKFVYSRVNPTERSGAVKQALELLCKARIGVRVQASHGSGVPLGADIRERVFKVVFVDVGLASAALGLSLSGVQSFDELALVNNGAVLEQVIGQMLRGLSPRFMDPELFYWAREQKGAEAEVDYLVQFGSRIVPVEVKSGKTGALKSLHLFMALRGFPLAVRFNTDLPSVTPVNVTTTTGQPARYTLLSAPFYLCGQLPRLINV